MVLSVDSTKQGPMGEPPPSSATIPALKRVVLAGNPNVGKSAIFNALTGLNADVSNYPGTTIDVSKGILDGVELVDTPGVYGLSSFNDEERIARNIIVTADVVINVASALSLDRDLFLTVQLIETGLPLLLVLNQWDEAQGRSIQIDTAKLSTLLGVPVITTVAVENRGIDTIRQTWKSARAGNIDEQLALALAPILAQGVPPSEALLLLEADEIAITKYGGEHKSQRATIYARRRRDVNRICESVITQEPAKQPFSTKLGRFLLHPFYGGLISLFICYLIFYQLLGVFVAGTVVDYTEKKGMRVYYEPNLRRLAATVFPTTVKVGDTTFDFPSGTVGASVQAQSFDSARAKVPANEVHYNFWAHHNVMGLVGNMLVGEYGVLTLTVTYLIGLLLPLVIGFYFGLSILEDSGYLPRLAVLVDRYLNRLGLNGRAIIPLILGLGCVTMATVTTRLLSTTREKIIATALLGIAIPCSAQLGIVSGTLAREGGALSWIVYGTVIGGMLATAGVLMNKVLPGKSQGLLIDLPPMRLPRANNVLKKTWTKSWNFMQESIPMFCIAGLVVTVGQVTGLLDLIIKVLSPITVTWLQLPADPRIATTFILGIVRRDFAAFGLTDVDLTAVQAVVAMIVITLFVPCIATVGVMIKERGMKIAMIIWFGSWLCAFVAGGLLSRALPPLFHAFGY